MPDDYSEDEIKEAVVHAIERIEERRERRKMQLGREVLRATQTQAAILDRNYRIVFSNRAADALFAQNDPFQLSKTSQLVCGNSTATERFHDGLRGSLHKHLMRRENAFIRVERERDKKPVIVVSIPKSDEVDNLYTYHVIFNDLGQHNHAVVNDLAVALNLSIAEARLAHALAEGVDLETASETLNISVNTARGYLKSIFEKTGVTRQAELVRLALLAVK